MALGANQQHRHTCSPLRTSEATALLMPGLIAAKRYNIVCILFMQGLFKAGATYGLLFVAFNCPIKMCTVQNKGICMCSVPSVGLKLKLLVLFSTVIDLNCGMHTEMVGMSKNIPECIFEQPLQVHYYYIEICFIQVISFQRTLLPLVAHIALSTVITLALTLSIRTEYYHNPSPNVINKDILS